MGKYKNVYLIVSPPRCASTALARVFWHQPSIRYYSHEPFELVYYERKPLNYALRSIENSIDLKTEYKGKALVTGNDLVIKEMTFQVGGHFPALLKEVNTSPIFLIRDPRLNISSRIAKIKEGGKQEINFPLVETGWDFLKNEVTYCDKIKRKYFILEANDFRNHPKEVFKNLFSKLKLPFDESMLNWSQAKGIKLDNLDGVQTHFYKRVLESKGIQPPTEVIPSINDFLETGGLRDHVSSALKIYRELLKNKNRIKT